MTHDTNPSEALAGGWGVTLSDANEGGEDYVELVFADGAGARLQLGCALGEAVDIEAVARLVADEHRAVLIDDPRTWRRRLAALLGRRIRVTRVGSLAHA